MFDIGRRKFIGGILLGFLGSCTTNMEDYLASFSEQGPIARASWGAIPIEFENIEIPQFWADYQGVEFSTVPEQKRNTKLGELERELKLYPMDFLEKEVRKIYVLESLSVFGNPLAGTRIKDGRIYTAYPFAFHGELSSLLYLNPETNFPTTEWNAVNPQGFIYQGYNSTRPLPDGSTHFADNVLLENGFIGPYAKWTEEEDFNLYFEKLFTEPTRLISATFSFPRVAEKTQLTIDYYNSVSGRSLTLPDFANIRNK